MGCATFVVGKDGEQGFICGEGMTPCKYCGALAEYLCDFPMGKGKTCDMRLCDRCRVRQEGDRWGLDFCRAHQVISAATEAQL